MTSVKWLEPKVPLAPTLEGQLPPWKIHSKKQMREKDWAPYKDKIIRLRNEGLTAEEIQGILGEEDGFHATTAQYKKILTDWMPKNLKRKQIRYIIYNCKRRGLQYGDVLPRFRYSVNVTAGNRGPTKSRYLKETKSDTVSEIFLDQNKVEETVKRYLHTEVFSPDSFPSPAGLSVMSTPMSYQSPGQQDVVTPATIPAGHPEIVDQNLQSTLVVGDSDHFVDAINYESIAVADSTIALTTARQSPSIEIVSVNRGNSRNTTRTEVVRFTEAPTIPKASSSAVISNKKINQFAEDLLQRLNATSPSKGEDVAMESRAIQPFEGWEAPQTKKCTAELLVSTAECHALDCGNNLSIEVEASYNGLPASSTYVNDVVDEYDDEILQAADLTLKALELAKKKQYKEALDLVQVAMEVFLRHQGLSNERYIYLYTWQGTLLYQMSRLPEALSFLKEACCFCEEHSGRFSFYTLHTMIELAHVYESFDLDQSEEICLQVIARISLINKYKRDSDLEVMFELAQQRLLHILFRQERYEEAERGWRSRIAKSIKMYGKWHPDTINLILNRGQALCRLNKYKLSLLELRKAWNLAAKSPSISSDDFLPIRILLTAAETFRLANCYDRSLGWYKDIIYRLRKSYPASYTRHPEFYRNLLMMAATYRDMKQYKFSLWCTCRALPKLIDLYGETSPVCLYGIELVCDTLQSRGLIRYVQPMFLAIPSLYERAYGPYHEKTLDSIVEYSQKLINLTKSSNKETESGVFTCTTKQSKF